MWLKAQLVWLISLPPNAPQFGQNALKNAPQQNFFTPSSIFITFLCINCFRCQIFLKEDSVYFNIDFSDISRLITIIMQWIKVAIVFFLKVPLITTNKFNRVANSGGLAGFWRFGTLVWREKILGAGRFWAISAHLEEKSWKTIRINWFFAVLSWHGKNYHIKIQ